LEVALPTSLAANREREPISGQLTGRHVVAILGLFFLVMFSANIALIYFALHTLHGAELENPYDASQPRSIARRDSLRTASTTRALRRLFGRAAGFW
jgi:nitrogen fixation protein FixH